MFRRFSKITNLGIVVFFIFLSDAILSFWVPNFLQESLSDNALLMGLVMSFSSVVGISFDFLFPQVVRRVSTSRLLFLSFIFSFLFALSLLFAVFRPWVVIFLIAMALWGIYYELIAFANRQFVADEVPTELHSSGWGIISSFKSLAYFLGPMIGGWLIIQHQASPVVVAIFFTGIGFWMYFFSRTQRKNTTALETKKVNFKTEFGYWLILVRHVWPILVLSINLFLIDSIFWTTGAILTKELSEKSLAGALFLPMYMLPSIVIWYPLSKMNFRKGKKRTAIVCLIGAGLGLIAVGLSSNIVFILAMVFVVSIFLSFSFPLVEAADSDVMERMGMSKSHLLGLYSACESLSYIIGPIIAGVLVQISGEGKSFSIAGVVTIIISLVLLVFTPRKLKLPQVAMQEWVK